jgi:Ca-activated chloride channel family protein
MEQIRSNGEQRELVDEVTELGTRYGIVTPYTSFLALEPGGRGRPRAAASDPARPDRRPVPSTRGMPPPPPLRASSSSPSAAGDGSDGRDGPGRRGAEPRRARDAGCRHRPGQRRRRRRATVQRVGDKTFYLREGVWTDAEIRADTRLPETTVTFGSDEYYALLGRVPALGRYFALGEQVAVIVDGRLYRVRAATH